MTAQISTIRRAASAGAGPHGVTAGNVSTGTLATIICLKITLYAAYFAAGGRDLPRLLDLQMTGKIDSWAIRWCYAQCKSGMLTVHPKVSKAINVGFGGTHVKYDPQYPVTLDISGRTVFDFGKPVEVEPKVRKQYLSYYGFFYRVKNYIRKLRA
jgi:hypothetical protein